MIERCEKIGGLDDNGQPRVIEIDESKFGKRKYNKGHHVEGQWVFGGIERGTGRCFMVPVEKRDTATLLAVIKNWITEGSIIISDCWKAYDCLSNEGYQHFTVNHTYTFVDPETSAHTNTIESSWRHAKIAMPVYNRRKEFISGNLAKFMFMRKVRYGGFDSNDPTVAFLKAAGLLYNPLNTDSNGDQHRHEDSDGSSSSSSDSSEVE